MVVQNGPIQKLPISKKKRVGAEESRLFFENVQMIDFFVTILCSVLVSQLIVNNWGFSRGESVAVVDGVGDR